MSTNLIPAFLTCYDYGTGGVWLLLDAPSQEAAQAAYPEFIVFRSRPDWMTEADEIEFRNTCDRVGYHWDISKPQTGWLKEFYERKEEPTQP